MEGELQQSNITSRMVLPVRQGHTMLLVDKEGDGRRATKKIPSRHTAEEALRDEILNAAAA
jgi:hypothetical protein